MYAGGVVLAGTGYADAEPYALVTTASDPIRERVETRFQPAPVVKFYEVELPDSIFFRVVDFADEKGSGTAGSIDFDGKTWTSIRVEASEIEESIDGELPELQLAISDPTHQVATFFRTHDGLVDQPVKLWIIPYDLIGEPHLARKFTFRVRGARVIEGPTRAVLSLGPPSLFDVQFPRFRFNRRRCWNDWTRRFTHDDRNLCSFPSDEFETLTRQTFLASADTETELAHGWFVLNGSSGINYFLSGYSGATTIDPPLGPNQQDLGSDQSLAVSVGGTDMRWKDGVRNGPYAYKKIAAGADRDRDIDVSAKLILSTLSDKAERYAGILVQNADALGEWIFWGAYVNAAGEARFLLRKSDGTTSVDTIATPGAGSWNGFRLARSGDTWTAYARDEDVAVQTFLEGIDDWNQITQQTYSDVFQGDPALHVGLFGGADSTAADDDVAAHFLHFRFLKGHFSECNRSFTNCSERNNLIQFNAFPSIPDRL